MIIHNMYGSPEYIVWNNMIQRCHNPKRTEYKKYGAVGINVCPEWLSSFSKFYDDMGDRPSLEHSIDRIDGTKGYYKDNCRWADWHMQSINTKLQPRNKTGYKGVFFKEDSRKFIAKITHYGKVINIGTYDTVEEAISGRLMAESIYW
jgi:hypothetical protein